MKTIYHFSVLFLCLILLSGLIISGLIQCQPAKNQNQSQDITSKKPTQTSSIPDSSKESNPHFFTMYASQPGEFVAFPDIVQTKNGEFWVTYRHGSAHVSEDGRIDRVRSSDGIHWSNPEIIYDDPEADDRDPSVYSITNILSEETLWINFFKHYGKKENAPATKTYILPVASENNRSSEPIIELQDPTYEWMATSADPLQLENNDILLPVYGGKPNPNPEKRISDAGFLRSKDYGSTWSFMMVIANGTTDQLPYSEPAMIQLSTGRILACIRTEQEMMYTYSDDNGYSWSDLQSSHTLGQAPDLLELPNQTVMVAFRCLDDLHKNGASHTQVAYQLSKDHGETWSKPIYVYETPDDPRSPDCAYPSLTAFQDENVLMVYYSMGGASIEGVIFNPETHQSYFEKRHNWMHALSISMNPWVVDSSNNQDVMTFTCTLTNSNDEVYKGSLTWLHKDNWDVTPSSVQLDIPSAERLDLEFSVKNKGNLYPLPKFSITPTAFTDIPETQKVVSIQRVIRPATTPPPLTIDAIKDDLYSKTEPIQEFCQHAGEISQADSTHFFFAYDKKNIYVYVKATESDFSRVITQANHQDDPVYQDDCIGFLMLPSSALNQAVERSIPIYQLYINTQGILFDAKHTLSRDTFEYQEMDVDWDSKTLVQVNQDDTAYYYELQIPVETFGIETVEPGDTWFINFRRKQQGKSAYADWMPFTDSFNYKTYGMIQF